MKVFLDDIRPKPDNTWILVRTYQGAADIITNNYNEITDISLDHDLGGEYDGHTVHKSGYDIVLLIEQIAYTTKHVPNITVHSMNPVGREAILRAIDSIKKYLEEC